MPWTKLDDGFYLNPKVAGLSDGAYRLYIQALNYSCDQLTDGEIRTPIVHMLVRVGPSTVKKRAAELVEAGLWIQTPRGWEINDFAEYQPSSSVVVAKRERNELTRLYKNKELRERIQARDRDLCRFCRREVSWTDRVSERSATYDHLTPGGGNSMENVVVACRGCNSRKLDRSVDELHEVGMVLLPPPGSNSGVTEELLPEVTTQLLGADVPEPEPEPEPELVLNGNRGVWGGCPPDIPFNEWVAAARLADQRIAEGYEPKNYGAFIRHIWTNDRDKINQQLARGVPARLQELAEGIGRLPEGFSGA